MSALTYQLFALLAGWLEALLYARRGAGSFTYNEHIGYTLQRVAVWLLVPVALAEAHWLGWWVAAELLPAGLLFPLVHDEAYNFTRLWLDCRAQLDTGLGILVPAADRDRGALRLAWQQYRYGYQSATTTARNDFNGRQRTWLAVAGVLVLSVGATALLLIAK